MGLVYGITGIISVKIFGESEFVEGLSSSPSSDFWWAGTTHTQTSHHTHTHKPQVTPKPNNFLNPLLQSMSMSSSRVKGINLAVPALQNQRLSI